MTSAQLKKLEREWAAKLRASGFQDIESPSGMVPQPFSHGATNGRLESVAAMDPDRALLERPGVFREPWERKAWALHCDGMSARAIATKMCIYRKVVDLAFQRLRAERDRRRPGGKPVPGSIRREKLALKVWLTPEARLAVDHLRSVLTDTSVHAVVRKALMEVAWETRNLPRSSPRVVCRHGLQKVA